MALVPGMAFYSAPADLAASLAAGALGGPAERVEVFYRLAAARPSRGTLHTNLRRIGQPCAVREGGHLVDRRIGEPSRLAGFHRWPGGEVLTVPRHTGADSVGVYLAMPKAAAGVLRRRRLTALLQPAGRFLVGRRTDGPSPEARRAATFVVVVEATDARGSAVRCVLEGNDLYGLTAAASAEAAQRLASPPEPRAGALGPAEPSAPPASSARCPTT